MMSKILWNADMIKTAQVNEILSTPSHSTINRAVVKRRRVLALGRNKEYTLGEDGKFFLGQ